MKVNEEKLKNQIDGIIAYGFSNHESVIIVIGMVVVICFLSVSDNIKRFLRKR